MTGKYAKIPLARNRDQAQFVNNAGQKLEKTKDNDWLFEWQEGNLSWATQAYVELAIKHTSQAKFFLKLWLKKEVPR